VLPAWKIARCVSSLLKSRLDTRDTLLSAGEETRRALEGDITAPHNIDSLGEGTTTKGLRPSSYEHIIHGPFQSKDKYLANRDSDTKGVRLLNENSAVAFRERHPRSYR